MSHLLLNSINSFGSVAPVDKNFHNNGKREDKFQKILDSTNLVDDEGKEKEENISADFADEQAQNIVSAEEIITMPNLQFINPNDDALIKNSDNLISESPIIDEQSVLMDIDAGVVFEELLSAQTVEISDLEVNSHINLNEEKDAELDDNNENQIVPDYNIVVKQNDLVTETDQDSHEKILVGSSNHYNLFDQHENIKKKNAPDIEENDVTVEVNLTPDNKLKQVLPKTDVGSSLPRNDNREFFLPTNEEKSFNDMLNNPDISQNNVEISPFVFVQTNDKKLTISFREIADKISENMPNRNEQITMAVRTAIDKKHSDITLKMYPENLGYVEINIEFAGASVVKSIKFTAEKSETLGLLASDYKSLERSLSEVVKSDNASLSFDLKNNGNGGENYQTPDFQSANNNVLSNLILQQNEGNISGLEYSSGEYNNAEGVNIKV